LKKILLVILLFLSFRNYSQAVSPNLASTLKHDTCLNKKFSIVFYLLPDSAFFPVVQANYNAIVNQTITPFINHINNVFKPICVSFENCSTVVIPNYPFSAWDQLNTDPIVTSNWYTDRTINFYLPVSASTTLANESGGYAYPPPANNTVTPTKDVIVCELSVLTTSNNVSFMSSEPLHIMGHFFGLSNTFDELGPPAVPAPPSQAVSGEFFDRTNCTTNGDQLCDTEADPYPLQFNASMIPNAPCYYDKTPGQLDGKGQYYVPPVDNIMSRYGCRCKFTQEQYNLMARTILKKRLYLH
jgi:hypothetical protein